MLASLNTVRTLNKKIKTVKCPILFVPELYDILLKALVLSLDEKTADARGGTSRLTSQSLLLRITSITPASPPTMRTAMMMAAIAPPPIPPKTRVS